MGFRHRTRLDGLWHAHEAADQGDLIYKRTKNLRAVQLLLGYWATPSSKVRYLGIEVDDALEISEQIEI